MNDVLNNASNVAVLLCEVESSKLSWGLVQARMGRWSCMLGGSPKLGFLEVDVLNMDPRPFRWFRITRPILTY